MANWNELESNECYGLIEAKVVSGPDAGLMLKIRQQGQQFFGVYVRDGSERSKKITKEVAKNFARQLRSGEQFQIVFDGGLI